MNDARRFRCCRFCSARRLEQCCLLGVNVDEKSDKRWNFTTREIVSLRLNYVWQRVVKINKNVSLICNSTIRTRWSIQARPFFKYLFESWRFHCHELWLYRFEFKDTKLHRTRQNIRNIQSTTLASYNILAAEETKGQGFFNRIPKNMISHGNPWSDHRRLLNHCTILSPQNELTFPQI